MRKTRTYTSEEKNQIISEVKRTGNIAAVARKNALPSSTIHTWLNPKNQKRSLERRAERLEVKKLKAKLADSQLENQVLKELLKKTYQIWDTD